jgi:hypothetical protein
VQILSETGDGNDLPPRHRKGQILGNVTFILAKEPALKHCERRWILGCLPQGG